MHLHDCISLRFSPDGSLLAVGGMGPGFVWHLPDGRLYRRLGGGENPLWLTFSPDGLLLAIGDGEHKVCIIPARLPVLFRLELGEFGVGPQSLAFSPDGTIVAVRYDDHTLRFFELGTGKEVRRVAEVDGPVCFSPDGKFVAVRRQQKLIALLSVATGDEVLQLAGHEDLVASYVFSRSGRLLVSGSDDQTVRVWEVATGRECACFKGHDGHVLSVAISPDSRLVASGGRDMTILLWDLTGRLRDGQLAPAHFTDKELGSLWDALHADDPGKAYPAIWQLVAAPEQAVALLRERLRPAPPVTEQRLARLVRDLDSDAFGVREQATEELASLDQHAEDALRQALKGDISLDAQKRIKGLLEQMGKPRRSGEALRSTRGLEVLELIGTADARSLLEALARGAPEARQTQEAQAALDRLKKRPAR
jgi:WD domain, G-beta repeat